MKIKIKGIASRYYSDKPGFKYTPFYILLDEKRMSPLMPGDHIKADDFNIILNVLDKGVMIDHDTIKHEVRLLGSASNPELYVPISAFNNTYWEVMHGMRSDVDSVDNGRDFQKELILSQQGIRVENRRVSLYGDIDPD